MAVDGGNPFVTNPWGFKLRGRSGFGRQSESKRNTAPAYSLGGSRDAREKVFLSTVHTNVDRRCREGPGHIYDLPGALDKQADARKESQPSYSFSHTARLKPTISSTPGPGVYQSVSSVGEQPLSANRSPVRTRFGTGTREQMGKLFLSSRHVAEQRGTQGAPPGSYDTPGALGLQPSSVRHSSPGFTLSRTDRLRDKYDQLSRTMPGPGQFETWNSIGKQTLSLSRTMPSYGFGTSDRDKEERRFLTASHAKTNRGVFSPSNFDHQHPGTLSSFGKQPLHGRQSQPSYGFGSQPRMAFKTSTTPGPGSYD